MTLALQVGRGAIDGSRGVDREDNRSIDFRRACRCHENRADNHHFCDADPKSNCSDRNLDPSGEHA
jgi:hypothetical protein